MPLGGVRYFQSSPRSYVGFGSEMTVDASFQTLLVERGRCGDTTTKTQVSLRSMS